MSTATTGPPLVAPRTRVTVYWTEMGQWFAGTVTSTKAGLSSDGRHARLYRVLYDSTAQFPSTAFYHDFKEVTWRLA